MFKKLWIKMYFGLVDWPVQKKSKMDWWIQRIQQSILNGTSTSPQSILDLFLDWSVHQSTSPKYILIHNFLNKNYVKSTFLLTCVYKWLIDKTWEIKIYFFQVTLGEKFEILNIFGKNCTIKWVNLPKWTGWNGLENEMEPLQFQSVVKIVMVTHSIPGLVGLIGLISPRLDWLLTRWVSKRK